LPGIDCNHFARDRLQPLCKVCCEKVQKSRNRAENKTVSFSILLTDQLVKLTDGFVNFSTVARCVGCESSQNWEPHLKHKKRNKMVFDWTKDSKDRFFVQNNRSVVWWKQHADCGRSLAEWLQSILESGYNRSLAEWLQSILESGHNRSLAEWLQSVLESGYNRSLAKWLQFHVMYCEKILKHWWWSFGTCLPPKRSEIPTNQSFSEEKRATVRNVEIRSVEICEICDFGAVGQDSVGVCTDRSMVNRRKSF
jgi:hypothetical protein